MRRTWWAWAALICAAAAGCLPDRAAAPTPTTTARSLGPASPDGVYVLHVLIERPVGDPLLDRELWAAGLPAARDAARALLSENGLRAVVLGGNLPAGLRRALATESETVNRQGLTFATRKDAVIPTAGPTDPCDYEVLTALGGERVKVSLRQAGGGVLVRPEPTTDGRVRVWCEPQVQYGRRQDWLRPTADGTQFVMQGELPLERYPALGFEVFLAAGEFLVIGWPADQPGTLGEVLFGVEASGRPRQRVLVLRAGRGGDATADDLPAVPNPSRRPSIAAEAGRSSGR
jgi:hypothetical protein